MASRATPRAVYVISVAAELAGMHPQTLRQYERRGLISPGRTTGGNRRYSEADVERLRRIGELSLDGISLEGVKRILDLEDEVAELRAALALASKWARTQVTEVERSHRRDLVPLRQSVVRFGEPPGWMVHFK